MSLNTEVLQSVERGSECPELIRNETLADVFSTTVLKHSDAAMLVDETGVLTYAEADALANRMAAVLRQAGARAGRFVGLWMARGRDVLISQIAIVKTGAAWVPFDADAPRDRVLTCLKDLGAIGTVTTAAGAASIGRDATTFTVTELLDSSADVVESDASTTDTAYVIFTSGSSGTPKGIEVRHSNICHFLRAVAKIYPIGADDRMLQCSSIAFDLSLEEIWLPYLVGAQLVLCPVDTLTEPKLLAALIRKHRVTCIDVVPTVLSLIDEELQGVRFIIVGGEACPQSLVSRYATPGRTLINSYGPSEATVVATAARLIPGQPVTIGHPLPNVSCYVVDEAMNLLPRGERGELLLGGPGIARGYVSRPELTLAKFLPNPFCSDGRDPILYRTGDAVAMTENGELLFHGRIDDQVKIRGFRIELGEIETVLEHQPGIAQAAAVVNSEYGFEQLVAFVVAAPGTLLDITKLKAVLRTQLPAYMVPSAIELTDLLPRLAASGKVDRKALSAKRLSPVESTLRQETVGTENETALLKLAEPLFPGQTVSLDADFFLDLGGHSLLAARFVSAARNASGFAHMTIGQVYEGRTLRGMAHLLDASRNTERPSKPVAFTRAPGWRRFVCGLAQLAVMPFLLTLMSAPWLAIFISYALVAGDDSELYRDIALVFGSYAVVNLAIPTLVLAAKWLILGRTKPGRYPLWGSYYFRVWLVQRLLTLVHLKWMQNTPVLRVYLRLLGAKVGNEALISDFDAGALDLIEFGPHVTTGSKVVFANARVEGAELVIGRIKIGEDASIGSSCVIEGDVEIGCGAELADLTSLAEGARVPAWQSWAGAPGVYAGDLDPSILPASPQQTRAGRLARFAIYLLGLIVLPGISIVPIVPAFRLMEWIDAFANPVIGIHYLWYMPILAFSAAGGMIAATLLLIVACRWLVLPRIRPGRYAMTSVFYLKRWAMNLLIEAALETLSCLFATLYMRAWYRLMGSKIGKGSEISTTFAGRYELIELGSGNFIADDVVLGDDHMRRNWLQLDTIRTGDQVFIGNEAVVPQGYTIESNALIGVKSKPPEGGVVSAGETWFGSPPIKLPARQRFEHDIRTTFCPPVRLKVARAIFEAFNVSLPNALFITLVTIVMEVLAPAFDRQHWSKAICICVAASVIIAIVQLLVAVGYKWLLMGRYRPTMKPLWSWWALRTEAVAVMYWAMAGKALLDVFRGTPFLPIALRLFGAKTGRGIYLDSTDITEFDCVTIGDHAVVNNHGVLQTHLYEDRLMKVGRIKVGAGAVVGAGSTVLYDTELGADCRLGPLTLLMKGEVIPCRSAFVGSPARPMSSGSVMHPPTASVERRESAEFDSVKAA